MRPHRELLRKPALIRAGRDDDAPRFIALIGRCWADYPNCPLDVDGEAPELRALASYYAAQGGALWIAEDGAGMVASRPVAATEWEICRVYVHPDRHGSGLGPALLQTAEAHAIAAGARTLTLWTDTRFARAHRFYEKHGYHRDPTTRALGDMAGTIEYRYVKQVAASGDGELLSSPPPTSARRIRFACSSGNE